MPFTAPRKNLRTGFPCGEAGTGHGLATSHPEPTDGLRIELTGTTESNFT